MANEKDTALMSLYVYQASTENSPVFSSPWTILKDRTEGTSGFAYAVFQGPGGQIVISYRGSDGFFSDDLLTNAGLVFSQERQAALIAKQYMDQYGAVNVSFTGHSLGGGLAATMAVWFNRPAIVFDPAPTQTSATDYGIVNSVIGTLGGANAPQSIRDYLTNISSEFVIREGNVKSYATTGSAMETIGNAGNTITGPGQTNPLNFGIVNMTSLLDRKNLHSQMLLTAGVLSGEFAQSTTQVQRALPVMFDTAFYNLDTTKTPRNLFLDLIKSEQQTAGDGKLTHLAASFNKLGANLSGLNAAAQDAIIAQTLEWYYWNTAFQNATTKQFFKLDAASGLLQYTTAQGSGFAGALNKANSDVTIWLNTLINPGAVQNSSGVAISYRSYQQWTVVGGTAGVMTGALDTSKGQVFVGNVGADVFVGGNKSDLLIGADGDDILQGKGGSDLLLGGQGSDTYLHNASMGDSGLDTIVDSDGSGHVVVDGQQLGGGSQYADNRVYRDPQGHTYTKVGGGRLVVDGKFVIEGWSDGKLGLSLTGPLPPVTPGSQTNLGAGRDLFTGSGVAEGIAGGGGGDVLAGLGGDDQLFGDVQMGVEAAIVAGNAGAGSPIQGDFLAGGAGNDTVIAGDTEDALTGGGGDDLLVGGAGDDVLLGDIDWQTNTLGWSVVRTGSNGITTIEFDPATGLVHPADFGVDVIYGGNGNDAAFGGRGNDVIFGDNGNDMLLGNGDNDVLVGGDGNDNLWGDEAELAGEAESNMGDDFLDGGAGNDQLVGGAGNDILIGGTGSDYLAGGLGQDVYVFNRGDGIDTVADNVGENNIFRFGAGFTASSIKLRLGSLLLDAGGGDQIHIENFNRDDVANSVSIDAFEFEDGSNLTSNELLARGFDLDGTAQNDVIIGTNITDRISGFDGDDVLFGRAGIDWLYGGNGNDTLVGDDGTYALANELHGADTLDGGAGDDLLQGNGGNDVLTGGSGHDTLQGGVGDDVYLFNLGDGQDIINEGDYFYYTIDTLRFGAGIAESDIVISRTNNLVSFAIANTSDQVQVAGWNWNWTWWGAAQNNYVDRVEFADGAAWDVLALQRKIDALPLVGTTGNDNLFGNTGDNVFAGGAGNDWLEGDAGSDTYLFSLGDGQDTISDADISTTGVDTLSFGAGILSTGIGFTRDQNGLTLRVLGTGDQVTSRNWGAANGEGNAQGIDRVLFADGTVWDRVYLKTASENVPIVGTALGETLYGNNHNDIFSAGAGDDVLNGFGGDDTYLFNLGDGRDTILEYGLAGAGFDTLRFGAGISASNVSFDRSGNDLILGVNNTAEQVTISKWSQSFTYQIEKVEFFDGTTWDAGYLQAGLDAVPYLGSNGADFIQGNAGANFLDAGAGNDSVYGYEGADTYYFDLGDGQDVVWDTGGQDKLRFGPGVLASDMSIARVGVNDLVLTNAASGDSVMLLGWAYDDNYRIENIEFDGGVNWNASYLQSLVDLIPILGTEGDDALGGGTGDNLMLGGLGDDTYYVNSVSDTVTEFTNEGIDRVYSSISYTLGNNLENLALTGAANTDATGNAAANVLDGNVGNNLLDGGGGADSMMGDVGDDVYVIDNPGDYVWEYANAGVDTVRASITYTLQADFENLTLTGTSTINGTGNNLDNILTGNSAVNTLAGGGGDDTYYVSTGDIVNEAAGAGTDTVFSAGTWTLANNVERLNLTGAAAVNATGNGLDNEISGNSAANTLTGLAGNDVYRFAVGGGADRVVDSAGNDRIVFGAGIVAGQITVTRTGSVIKLAVNGSDSVSIDQISPGVYAVEQFEFADGSVLGASWLTALIPSAPPTATNLSAAEAYTEDTARNLVDIVVADADSTTTTVTLTLLNLTAGSFNTGTSGAVTSTFSAATGVWTAAGVIANVNTLLAALTFTPTANFNGNFTVATSVTDGLSTPVTGVKSFTGTKVNDAPTGVVTITGTVVQNQTLTASHTLADVDGLGAITYQWQASGVSIVGATGATLLLGSAQIGKTISVSANYTDAQGTAETKASTATTAVIASFVGTTGADTLNGSTAADQMSGLAGNDNYVVNNAGDVVIENLNEGTDLVNASVSYTLAANVENITLTGTSAINATGNALNNVLTGNSGANVLTVGAGDDTYVIGAGDTVVEAANGGIDTVQSAITHTLAANVENLTLTGTSAINGTGNGLDNVLTGNSAVNVLAGGAGNDTYVVTTGDTTTEAANAGTDTVQSAVAWTLATNLENLVLTGTAAVNGTGNTADNVLTGNSGVNTLTGNAGNDMLDGKAGADALIGGTGNDTYWLGRGYGIDTITENDATVGNTDLARFDAGIATDQLWFRQVSNNLEVSIIGTSDKFSITNWYLGNANHVEQFKTSDGKTLLDSQVQNLVSAMAAFAPPAAGQTTLPTNYATSLQPVIAANWV